MRYFDFDKEDLDPEYHDIHNRMSSRFMGFGRSGSARVVKTNHNSKILFSYNTPVVEIFSYGTNSMLDDRIIKEAVLYPCYNYSSTTRKAVSCFMRNEGFEYPYAKKKVKYHIADECDIKYDW